MRRVPWTVIGGDEVETIVSMALFNEHKHAQRIRPSQGDYGIDVLVPNANDGATWDVYQIKKFAQNLDNSQKRQIEKSFKRVLVGRVRKDVPLADWYIVMPLDPTLENLQNWFEKMPDRVIGAMMKDPKLKLTATEKRTIRKWRKHDGRVIEWKGLSFCDNLMAKYWFVQDYYLNSGEERINSAIREFKELVKFDREVEALSATDTTALMDPSELRSHLFRLQGLLDGDPHYSFGISLGPNPSELSNEPGLVGALQERTPNGGYLVFKVYARFDEAIKIRPIPGSLKFDLTDEEFDQVAFNDWRKYGKPLIAPAAVTFSLPGGLSVDGRNSIVEIGTQSRQSNELRFRVVSDEGPIGHPISIHVTYHASPEGLGAWTDGSDASGVLRFEAKFDREAETISYRLGTGVIFGADLAVALPALELMSNLKSGNTLQVSERYGPFRDVMTIEEGAHSFPKSVVLLVRALVQIQEFVREAIKVPEPEEISEARYKHLLEISELLQGRQIMFAWEKLKLEGTSEMQLEENGLYQIQTVSPLVADLPGMSVRVGYLGTTYSEARLSRGENGDWVADATEMNSAEKELCDPVEADQGEKILAAFSAIVSETTRDSEG